MAVNKKPDYVLFFIVISLLLFGILILTSVSGPYSQQKYGSPYTVLLHQMLYGYLPGLIFGFIAFKLPISFLKKIALPALLLNIVLLALVFVPGIGMDVKGAARWLNLGITTIQPSELLKITFFLYLAAWIAKATQKTTLINRVNNKTQFPFWGFFAPFVLILGTIGAFLYFQPDISTLGIIGITALIIYFVAKTPIWQTFFIIGSGITLLLTIIKFEPYRLNRFKVLFDSAIDPMGIGYQIKQALIGIGSGGIFGTHLGMSRQKFGFLPESIGDAIFAIFAEEMGFVGGFCLVALFGVLAWRGFLIAKRNSDKFSQLLAVGLTSWIVLQAFMNIGSMTKIMPLMGIPLPFVSYGGTALMVQIIAMGLLLNVSRQKS